LGDILPSLDVTRSVQVEALASPLAMLSHLGSHLAAAVDHDHNPHTGTDVDAFHQIRSRWPSIALTAYNPRMPLKHDVPIVVIGGRSNEKQ
jgi:hypothetical protein